MVCGPTASGKSGLADLIAAEVGARTILVDSIQVYGEISEISNQRRDRPADLCGIVSVEDEWSVAYHRDAALDLIEDSEYVVLDAGTGMYLNAILLDFPLSPRVPEDVRNEAQRLAGEYREVNRRRLSRSLELRATEGDHRGSVWEGDLRFDTHLIYLRPDRAALDARIEERSRLIATGGTEEAERLIHMNPTPTVSNAIGVREMTAYVRGEATRTETVEAISTRTRQLSRRQMRWFDKLIPTLASRINHATIDNTSKVQVLSSREVRNKNTIHDMIRAWKD